MLQAVERTNGLAHTVIPPLVDAVAQLMRHVASNATSGTATQHYTGRTTAKIPLDVYIAKCVAEGGGTTQVLVLAVIYLDRLCRHASVTLCKENVHRVFLTAFVVASKHHHDLTLSNAVFATIGGVTLAELNDMEMQFLQDLRWEVHVKTSLFSRYYNELRA
eukprot:TRINITY_DN5360_c0_g1_i2.p1 TRINITY_DN5360_c0_g1~~TRINITY_DN5360_c0_g1_i2.p1  ORF type:complete len:162 (+),score=73.47 TRINITY_DN5360_c0_g1_i2:60-545(+)